MESWFPAALVEHLRSDNHVFSDVLGWAGSNTVVSVEGEPQEVVRAGFYGGNYDSVVGVRAQVGRTFTSEDDRPGQPPVAVLSDRFWTARFGRRPSAVGQTIAVRGALFKIIGVTRPGFNGLLLPVIEPHHLAVRDNSQDVAVPLIWLRALTAADGEPDLHVAQSCGRPRASTPTAAGRWTPDADTRTRRARVRLDEFEHRGIALGVPVNVADRRCMRPSRIEEPHARSPR